MMVDVEINDKTVIISPKEKIDYASAPDFEKIIKKYANDADSMIIDMKKVDYISSAGLRTLIIAENLMSEKNGVIIKNTSPCVKEILDMTGFSQIMKIE